MKMLTDEMISGLLPAETSSFPSPVPTQIVSSDEFPPVPQTARQREVEARLIDLSDRIARRQGQSRRRFFQTAAGMAASFVALNQVFGPLFDASEAEAATPELAQARADALAGQLVIDGHTHFLRDDTRLMGFVKAREAVGPVWLEQGTQRQGTDDCRSEIRQLRQRNLYGQRHQGGVAVELTLRRAGRLVHSAGASVQNPRDGEQAGRLPPDAGAFHDHAGAAGLAREGRRGDRTIPAGFVEGLHGRRQHAQGTGRVSVARRRPEADVSVLREDRQNRHPQRLHPQRACSRRRSKRNSLGCGPMPMSATSAAPPRTGRS